MLNIQCVVLNNFEENTYIVTDQATGDTAIIDPGMLYESEKEYFAKYITDHNLRLTQVILTHAHLDHCFGADYVRSRYNVPVKLHKDDVPLVSILPEQARRFGMANVMDRPLEYDVELKDGDIIEIGKSRLKVLHVPGHSPGGIMLYDEEDSVAFVGDSIFRGSIGRTDLPGGDYATLINAIKSKIFTLPDNTVLLSGHGEPTDVATEKSSNPYF